MAEAGSHHLGAGVRAQASRQQPGLWGRGELQDQGQGPLGTAGATPEELFMPATVQRILGIVQDGPIQRICCDTQARP